jgi:hypothetical protein
MLITEYQKISETIVIVTSRREDKKISNLIVFFTLTKEVITCTVVDDIKLTMRVEFMSTFTIWLCAHIYAHYHSNISTLLCV